MKLATTSYEINNGLAVLGQTAIPGLLTAALAAQQVKPTAPTQKQFTRALTASLRDVASGWQATELRYASQQTVGRGRRGAIDYFHVKEGVGVEMELGNQTVFTHDLLKLELAFKTERIAAGIILTASASARKSMDWNRGNCYLTLESASRFLPVFGPALTVPLVVFGFEP